MRLPCHFDKQAGGVRTCFALDNRFLAAAYQVDSLTRNDVSASRFPGADLNQFIRLDDIRRTSTMLVRRQKQTGRTETQSFKIQLSKSLIDEIDRVLARHYGFTAEELDFLINYDIKYRMGQDAGNGGEEGAEA